MALVGTKAPQFEAPAVINGQTIVHNFSLQPYLGKQEVLLIFYPKDFTYVCPTELLSFQRYLHEFEQRHVAIVACSTDTEESHLAWLNLPVAHGGIQGVIYPIIADSAKTIAANYGVLAGNWEEGDREGQLAFHGNPIAYRGVFLIDKEGIIRYEAINDLALGRSVSEVLRVIDMLQHTQKFGEVCPANWEPGLEAVKPTPAGISHYLNTHYATQPRPCCGGGCGCDSTQQKGFGYGCCDEEEDFCDCKPNCNCEPDCNCLPGCGCDENCGKNPSYPETSNFAKRGRCCKG